MAASAAGTMPVREIGGRIWVAIVEAEVEQTSSGNSDSGGRFRLLDDQENAADGQDRIS
jgi:hypothetical protein